MYKPRVVKIGDVPLGEGYPIRLQSMTNTNTLDTDATVDQCIRIIKAGADYVRITTRNIKEAENLRNIQDELHGRGYNTPLIADVHFNPGIAETAARIVEKVRINPGNFTEGKIREKLAPLLTICKSHKTALRIGVNHGSLSDRIMKQYGDTPEGMVESAMEYLRICVSENFYDVVVSLKSSNTRIMIQANRLLVKKMQEEKMDFPLHLGITEAGEGEDGRVKSAAGIGTLLAEGLGNTIRVSLTEDPELELPVAKDLASIWQEKESQLPVKVAWNLYDYWHRETLSCHNIGSRKVPVVIVTLSGLPHYDKIASGNTLPDYLYTGNNGYSKDFPSEVGIISNYRIWKTQYREQTNYFPLFQAEEYFHTGIKSRLLNFVQINPVTIDLFLSRPSSQFDTVVLVLSPDTNDHLLAFRKSFSALIRSGLQIPVIVKANFSSVDKEVFQIHAASELSGLFIDGLGNGLWIENSGMPLDLLTGTTLKILQASRARIFKTEYIACPSCGRTLFNIRETLDRVRNVTSHLKHLKIAVMGCIVNGPGEMADADYGYVGSAPGKITLYKGKELIKKNVREENAVDELVQLIKDSGDWIEP